MKGLNDTLGGNGLAPSFSVFGMICRLPIISQTLPGEAE